MWAKLTSVVAAVLAMSSCSLVFDDSGKGEVFSGDDRPLYRFDFEESDAEVIYSSGRDPLEVRLLDGAVITDGALYLEQAATSSPYSRAQSVDAAREANTECMASEALTIAAWVTTSGEGPIRSLPARILTIEDLDGGTSNFTLGQGGDGAGYDKMSIRVGMTGTTGSAQLIPADGLPFFVFFAMGPTGEYRFQVGDLIPTRGSLSAIDTAWDWTPDRPLVMGGEDTGNRPWKGSLHHVEFYCRELDEGERVRLMEATDPR